MVESKALVPVTPRVCSCGIPLDFCPRYRFGWRGREQCNANEKRLASDCIQDLVNGNNRDIAVLPTSQVRKYDLQRGDFTEHSADRVDIVYRGRYVTIS